MAGEIIDAHAARLRELTLVPGTGGVFQIRVGDRVVYDKKTTGKFPAPGESAKLIQER